MIIFKNKGLIDIRAIKTMGVSVKSDSAIGYFGTGLKYALAVLLREGQEVTIYRGEEAHEFTASPAEIRGQDFDIVCMNGEELAFTTELGKNWEIWQAFRELYCNCKDEEGETVKGDSVEPEEGCTTITVKGVDFERVYDDRALYFIEGEPDIINDTCDIYLKPANGIFYKGVRVTPAAAPYPFTYNIKRKIDLSEDRNMIYTFQARDAISRAVASCHDKSLIEKVLTASGGSFESTLDFDISDLEPSEEFIEVCQYMAQNFHRNDNKKAIRYAQNHAKFEANIQDIELNEVQEAMLKRALTLLDKADFNVENFPIRCVETLGTFIHGQAKEGTIFITEEAFHQGTKELAITLLEEYWHLKYGFDDETRAFQNHLFSQIGTLIERLNGEAF